MGPTISKRVLSNGISMFGYRLSGIEASPRALVATVYLTGFGKVFNLSLLSRPEGKKLLQQAKVICTSISPYPLTREGGLGVILGSCATLVLIFDASVHHDCCELHFFHSVSSSSNFPIFFSLFHA